MLALHVGVDKDRKIRRYLDRQEFKFTTLLKGEQTAEAAFGMKLSGSALLIGADGRVLWRGLQINRDEILRALEGTAKTK